MTDGPLGNARYCLRLMFDPMVQVKVRKGATPAEARAAASAWIAGEMGIKPEEFSVDGMGAAETWLAVNIIREWRQARTKVRDALHREEKQKRNEFYDRQRQLHG